MSRFVQFWCKLSTSSIVKTCPFRFPRDYYGDSLDVMLPQLTISYRFPWCLGIVSLVFLQLPRMLLLGVSTTSSMLLLGVSTTSSDASPCCFYNFLGCFSLVFLQLPRMLLLGASTTSLNASPWCFYKFLRCFYCFPSVFPPFPIYFRFYRCLICF